MEKIVGGMDFMADGYMTLTHKPLCNLLVPQSLLELVLRQKNLGSQRRIGFYRMTTSRRQQCQQQREDKISITMSHNRNHYLLYISYSRL